MEPFTIALACVGVSLSAKLVTFITGEITEKEKQKYQAIIDRINSIRSKFSKLQGSFQAEKDAAFQAHDAQMSDAENRLQWEFEQQEQGYRKQREQRENYRKQRQKEADRLIGEEAQCLNENAAAQQEMLLQQMVTLLKERSDDRIRENEELIGELKEAIAQVKKYNMEQCTEMRKNAFRLLLQELRIGLNKARSYGIYLKKYQNVLETLCRQENADIIFSIRLPQRFPYFDEIIHLSDAEIQHIRENGGWGDLYFHGLIRIQVYVKDMNLSQTGNSFLVEDNAKYPCHDGEMQAFGLSSDKAAYYLCKRGGCFTGLPATVIGYDRVTRDVLLKCGENMQLRMQQQNLLNSAHHPAIRSEITVYPLRETYQFNEGMRYYVTQRFEDTEISLTFREIPVVIPPDKMTVFCEYFRTHQIDKEYDDAKIAPADENDVENNIVKIQFQDAFLMRAIIRKHRSETMYFEFESFPDSSEGIHAENIFVSFHAVIKMLDRQELDELLDQSGSVAVRDEMTHLVMTVFREFRQQKEMKAADQGGRYFQAWEQMTAQLKEYLTAGDSVICTVAGFPYVSISHTGDTLFRFPIMTPDVLRKYYDKQFILNEGKHFLQFFTAWKTHRLNVIIHSDFESVTVVLPKIYVQQDDSSKMELQQLTEIEIYLYEFCIPEQRQLTALYMFKSGRMANSDLHLFALNSAAIHPDYSEIGNLSLKNSSLASDGSQYGALTGALREKNWFMIQGPPGTGKTTVIRELIWQTLQAEPRSKILIVSQANVAVDNVLRGLLKAGLPSDRILRCGQQGKIAEDIRPVSYETKMQVYLDRLQQKSAQGDQTAMMWMRILDHSSQKNADLGNLFMLSHQIIGATCVGLAQKRIGLETAVFDLVIVDEAGKALMPEVLIPLNKAKKLILIGDHKQLPPVVNPALYDPELIELDDRSYFKKEIFDTSFFEREFISCPESNKTILTTQYRMPPMIGTMISTLFYNGQIQNGVGTENKLPLYFDTSMSLIDMSEISSYCESENGSPTNDFEAQYVLYLVKEIQKKTPGIKIAVITPYKGQKRRILELIWAECADRIRKLIAVDTVDSFQGDEAEIVIYCTTRARRKTLFFSDYRRLNVAFSRAKNELIVLASVKYLEKYRLDEPIHKVLDYFRLNHCIRKPVSGNEIRIRNRRKAIQTVPMKTVVAKPLCTQEAVSQEIMYYEENGEFSVIPIAKNLNDQYIIIEGSPIYFAACSMGLENLTIKVDGTYSESDSVKNEVFVNT